MATTRTYNEACGIPRALDRVGERWALMVVRELVLGPKRFTDLRTGLPHASPNVLAQRLRELEQAGVVRKRKLPPPAASQVYELTDWGHELDEVLLALGRWGARAPGPPDGVGMSFDAHILSLQTLFRPELAADVDATFQLRFGDDAFIAHVRAGRLSVERGEAHAPDATIEGDIGSLLAVVHGRLALEESGLIISGDRGAAEEFMELFPLPEPATVPVAA
jgi:DNA-binding HxlR family transcriptional regulator